MIVGKGMVARAFAPRFASNASVIVFASGVSNSNETRGEAFDRERDLLASNLKLQIPLLYFSSCGVGTSEEHRRPYIAHKATMEGLVLDTPKGRVIRLPQVVGRTNNPYTLTNFLRDRILANESIELWTRAERNLIDIDDVAAITMGLLEDWPKDLRVTEVAAPKSVFMREIIAGMEAALNKRANLIEVDAGTPLQVNPAQALLVARKLGIRFDAGYTARLLQKYYGDGANP